MFSIKQSSYWTLPLKMGAVTRDVLYIVAPSAIPRITQGMASALRVLIRGERFAKVRRTSIAKMSLELLGQDRTVRPAIGARSIPDLREVSPRNQSPHYVACTSHAADEQIRHAGASLGMANLPRYASRDRADL